MAKKAAAKSSARKAKEKPKTAKAVKPAAKAAPKKASKPETPKPAKEAAKEKTAVEKVARAPKVPARDEGEDTQSDSEDAEVEEKPVKAAKVKPERISAAQKKLDRAMAESSAQWSDLHQKHSSEKAQTYDMRATFEAHKPLQHKVLGWGWIMSVENDRLEVIFQDGKRMLISNYKAR